MAKQFNTVANTFLHKYLPKALMAALFVSIVGVAFWLSHFPMANMILYLGFISLGIILITASFFPNKIDTKATGRPAKRFAFMGTALVVFYMLNRLQFEPVYEVGKWLGLFFLGIAFIIELGRFKKIDFSFLSNRISILSVAVLILFMNVDDVQLFAFRESEDQRYIELFKQMRENPENETYRKAFEKYGSDRMKGIRYLPAPK